MPAIAQAPEEQLPVRTFTSFTTVISAIAFSPDGHQIASANSDHTITLWDVATGQSRLTLNGHTQPVTAVAFSPDGHLLASGSDDHNVKLWDITTGKEVRTLGGHSDHISAVAFSPDGRLLVSASFDKSVKLWEVASGKLLVSQTGHTAAVYSVAFAPDGKQFASAADDYSIRFWDVATGKQVRALSYLTDHSDRVYSIAFSADGKKLAAGSFDNTIKIWDVTTGNKLPPLIGHAGAVTSVAFSPDGRLGSASWDHTVRLWDVTAAQELRILRGHSDLVFSVAFSPDGLWIASGGADHTVKLWGGGGAVLEVRAQPGAQVSINDEVRGVTDIGGALTLFNLKPGHYRVQAQLAGYKDAVREVDLVAGARATVELQSVRLPLTEAEIEDGLRKGVTPERMAALVKQYGVDFSLTPEIEDRLRKAGGDDTLLSAIGESLVGSGRR